MSLPVKVISPIGQLMLLDIPSYWREFQEMRAIMQAVGVELDRYRGFTDTLALQFYITTATYGLPNQESEYGIETDIAKPIGERRSVVLAKARGLGTVTPQMIERVAQAYERGLIEVVNINNPPGTFTIRFIDTLGTPPNIPDMKNAIEDIKPAHLEVLYAYRYLRIREIHRVLTLRQMNATRLDKFTPGQQPTEEG